MIPVTKTVYQARDGQEFATEAECRAHERKHAGGALIGLTEDRIEAARQYLDIPLADAIEAFAYEIAKKRKASGVLRRTPKPKGEPGPARGPKGETDEGQSVPAEYAGQNGDPYGEDGRPA
jgi:hypothetical protein